MLKINEKYRVVMADDKNYELVEYREVKDRKTKSSSWQWVHVGWYGKLSHALESALNKYALQLIGEEEFNCKALLAKLFETEKDLSKIEPKKKSN